MSHQYSQRYISINRIHTNTFHCSAECFPHPCTVTQQIQQISFSSALKLLFVCCFCCVYLCVCVLSPSPGGRRFIRAAGVWTPSDVALNFKLQTFLATCTSECVCFNGGLQGVRIKHMWSLTCICVPLPCNLYLNLWTFGLCMCICVCVYLCVCVCVCSHMVQVAQGGIPSGFHFEHTYTHKLTAVDDCTFVRMIRLRKKTLQSPNSW